MEGMNTLYLSYKNWSYVPKRYLSSVAWKNHHIWDNAFQLLDNYL
jgi:hypothetical protein